MDNIFSVPNLDKNVRISEKENGLELSYTLPCGRDFPYTGYRRKNNTHYYTERTFVKYDNNMSQLLTNEYFKLKNSVMLKLNNHKLAKLTSKVHNLRNQQLTLNL